MGQQVELVLIVNANRTNKESPSRFIIIEKRLGLMKDKQVYFKVILPTVSRFLSFTRSA